MVKAESEPVSEKELEEESDIEEIVEKDEKSFRDKDGTGYGDLMTTNVMPNLVNTDSETYVGKPAPSNNQTYIEESKSNNMVDANKLTHTRVGDYINFYQNGVQDSGVVAKMGSAFITIFKEDGSFHNVHINDTFFVSDILVNKTWNDMDMEERAEELMKVKAYSPRYLSKTWEQLPKELQSVLKAKGTLPQKFEPNYYNPDKNSGTKNPTGFSSGAAHTRMYTHLNDRDQIPTAVFNQEKYQKEEQKLGDSAKKSDQEQGAYGNIGGRHLLHF